MAYNDKSITFSGNLLSYDYEGILRDKQRNIIRLFELSDYYVDADPIYRGIIKNVYTPFSMAEDYRLIGANERVKQKYEEYYDRIHLRDRMRSIFLQLFKYGNVYVYLMEDGNLITLPVHMVRIANIMADGEPLVEFNCQTIKRDLKQQGIKAQKEFLDDEDLKLRLSGFPEEVADAVQKGKDWVQLNPENTFVLQDLKEDWMRYAVPIVATCLKAFAKKELIAQYEASLLNLGISSFVHVSYGDAAKDIYPDRQMLSQVQALFAHAMDVRNGVPLVTTNNFVRASVVQPDMNDLFQDDHYAMVNSEILSAGGISGIVVSGIAGEGSTFATAQVSMQTAAIRIKQAQDNFCEMMDRINLRLNGVLPHSRMTNIPRFTFPPVDLAGSEKFRQTCLKLWEAGVVSTKTMLQTHGYDIGQEVELRKQEMTDGTDKILSPMGEQFDMENEHAQGDNKKPPLEKDKGGRPEMEDYERNSDPAKALTGKVPKPSRPEGSLT